MAKYKKNHVLTEEPIRAYIDRCPNCACEVSNPSQGSSEVWPHATMQSLSHPVKEYV